MNNDPEEMETMGENKKTPVKAKFKVMKTGCTNDITVKLQDWSLQRYQDCARSGTYSWY